MRSTQYFGTQYLVDYSKIVHRNSPPSTQYLVDYSKSPADAVVLDLLSLGAVVVDLLSLGAVVVDAIMIHDVGLKKLFQFPVVVEVQLSLIQSSD